ncbi:hypothetical protein WOLCODRAFT_15975 [Wolfiporia cocos MD-104 SS10]|uniref:Uncharacterized protein n=1 Tax=Wolfiporia cocos (strain MD-104) TaxID=742152 RepID=A0A2H3JIN4_WOLCO|nr:hypothetical protein WOLCODRAFT_15975 [Wolfiporia cocos MD-104 SS10]
MAHDASGRAREYEASRAPGERALSAACMTLYGCTSYANASFGARPKRACLRRPRVPSPSAPVLAPSTYRRPRRARRARSQLTGMEGRVREVAARGARCESMEGRSMQAAGTGADGNGGTNVQASRRERSEGTRRAGHAWRIQPCANESMISMVDREVWPRADLAAWPRDKRAREQKAEDRRDEGSRTQSRDEKNQYRRLHERIRRSKMSNLHVPIQFPDGFVDTVTITADDMESFINQIKLSYGCLSANKLYHVILKTTPDDQCQDDEDRLASTLSRVDEWLPNLIGRLEGSWKREIAKVLQPKLHDALKQLTRTAIQDITEQDSTSAINDIIDESSK